MKVVTNADFEQEVLKSDKPVLIDFYADWCGPCKQLSPLLEQLAQETPDVKIVKVNIDASPELAQAFQVRSIPTLVIMRDGVLVAHKVGGAPKAALAKWVADSIVVTPIQPLSQDDKQRLRDAFAAAVKNSPQDEQETLRTLINKGLDDGTTFKNIEKVLSVSRTTLDEVVENIKRTKYTLGPKG